MEEEIKASEMLYNINRMISLKCVGMNQLLNLNDLRQLNRSLAEIIKLVRELEEKNG